MEIAPLRFRDVDETTCRRRRDEESVDRRKNGLSPRYLARRREKARERSTSLSARARPATYNSSVTLKTTLSHTVRFETLCRR